MGVELAAPAALAPLLSGLPPKPGVYLAGGPELLPSWVLQAAGPALGRGAGLFWIDGGSPFDAYGSSCAAKARGLDPKALLKRVRLARAFNLWQLEAMVLKKLPPLWKGESVVLAHPLSLFYDEDLPLAEARAVLARLIAGMEALPAVWLVLNVEGAVPEGREALLADLSRRAFARARLLPAHDRWRLERLER